MGDRLHGLPNEGGGPSWAYIYTKKICASPRRLLCRSTQYNQHLQKTDLHSCQSVISAKTPYAYIPFVEGDISRGYVLIQGLRSRLAGQSRLLLNNAG